MIYEILWVENKKDDWKIASLRESIEGGLEITDVSINKVDKKGRSFPGWDSITPGATVTGNLWQNPANQKYTLFAPDLPKPAGTPPAGAPRPATTGGGGMRGVAAAQERKTAMIKDAQENKGRGMMVAGAFRDATLILINHTEYATMTFEESKAFHKRIRDWYMAEYKSALESLDVPF